MKRLANSLVLISLTFLGACTFFISYKEESNKVQELQEKRDSLQTIFEALDTETISKIGKKTMQHCDSILWIVKNKNKSLAKEDAMFLGRYKSLSKPYRKLGENSANITLDLELSTKQLTNLALDVKNKSVSRDSIQLFIKEEAAALVVIAKNIESLKSSKISIVKEFDDSQAEINRIFKSL